jgi:CSLREA domain-containing protein
MNQAKSLSGPLRTALILLGAIASAAVPATARANTITVNTLTDEATSGDRLCSLREAINNANSATDTTDGDCAAGSGDDKIKFKVEGTIALTSTLRAIVHTLTFDGGGQVTIDGAVIQGTFIFQVLLVSSSATLEVDNLTIENGNAVIGADTDDEGGTLTVRSSTFSNNTAFDCGAIFATGADRDQQHLRWQLRAWRQRHPCRDDDNQLHFLR